jgi:hypothetical protein
MTTLLVDQEFCGTGITVLDSLCELESVAEDGLADIFVEMRSRCDLDDL